MTDSEKILDKVLEEPVEEIGEKEISVANFIDTLRESGTELIVLLSLDGGVLPASVKKTRVLEDITNSGLSRSDTIKAFIKEVDGNNMVFIDHRFVPSATGENGGTNSRPSGEKLDSFLRKLEQKAVDLPENMKGDFYELLGDIYRG